MTTKQLDPIREVNGSIPQYFAGKNVFITGFTGFLGKFLVQKILTDVPDVGKIYVLIREKNNKMPEEKLQIVLENPLFEHLHGKKVLDKIIPIKGDITQQDLGISETSRQELVDNVNIIYHVAASVRFDMALSDAVMYNVRATRDICKLALDLKKCDALMYVSTAYCQVKHGYVEEKLYPSPFNWKKIIELAENMDKFELTIMSQKFMEGYPNTYTFTKAIAESVVEELCGDKVPRIIFRPSIVTSADQGPVPGWCDNFNGPGGILYAFSKGLIRYAVFSSDIKQDYVAVDSVINYMIKATWMQQFLRSTEISVYNCTSPEVNKITGEEFKRQGLEVSKFYLTNPIWHIEVNLTDNMTIYYLNMLLFHFLPCLFIDFFLGLAGQKQILSKLQRKIFNAFTSLQYFLFNGWDFANSKCFELDERAQGTDKITFYGAGEVDAIQFILNSQKFFKTYVLREEISKESIRRCKRRLKIFAAIHLSIKYTTLILTLIWLWNHVCVHILDNVYEYLVKL